jgi:hypothetical protein
MAMALVSDLLDCALGRDPGKPVTIYLDAAQITVDGRH